MWRILPIGKIFAQKCEKITVQRHADSHQQFRVNTVFAEQTIHIRTVKTQLVCKPCYGPLLRLEFLLDQLAELYHLFLSVPFPCRRPEAYIIY